MDIPHGFNNLGAIRSKKRKDDITHNQVVRILPTVPSPPVPSSPIDISIFPIYYQGQIGACVSHAVTWMMMFLDYLESKIIPDYTPRFNYALDKRDDGLPSTQGVEPAIAINELINHGVCDSSFLPNDVTLPYETYKDSSLISSSAFDNALPRQAQSQVIITDTSWKGIKSALSQYKILAGLVDVGAEWWTSTNGTISWDEKDVLPLRPPKIVVSGHEIVLLDSKTFGLPDNYIFFVNSWSDRWGKKGLGYFSPNYIPFLFEARAIVDLPDWVVNNLLQQKSLLIKVVNLLKQLLGL